MVIVDVFDGAGRTPPVFSSPAFAATLGILCRKGGVALTNIGTAGKTRPAHGAARRAEEERWEAAHKQVCTATVEALSSGFGSQASAWSISVAQAENVIVAVVNGAAPGAQALQQAAAALAAEGTFAFDPAARLARGYRLWGQ